MDQFKFHPKLSKKLLRIFFLICIIVLFGCKHIAPPNTEIVISTPVETDLHNELIKNTAHTWKIIISSAKKNIDLAFFYLVSKKNEILEPIVKSLIQRSEYGVKIRILTEKKMIDNSSLLIKRLERYSNIKIVIFDWKKKTGGVLHAKYFIVDNKYAFIGSQNFDWRSLKHIQETGLLIRDRKIITGLKQIFEIDWKFNSGDKSAYDFEKDQIKFEGFFKNNIFLTASPAKYNPPGIPGSLKNIVRMIKNSREKITIQLLSYTTSVWRSKKHFLQLNDALKAAAGRGVKIKMIVSDWNLRMPGVISLKKLAKKKGIDIKFIRIPVSKEGFIPYSRVVHSKVMRIDKNILMISTSNWSRDYFFRSRNVEVFLKNRKTAKILDKLFFELWNSKYSHLIDPDGKYTPPRIYLP